MAYRFFPGCGLVFLAISGLYFGGCQSDTDPTYIAEIQSWHEERLTQLRSETGWLTLVGLHELKAGANSIGSAEGMTIPLTVTAPAVIGHYNLQDDGISFTTEPGVPVQIDAEEPRGITGTIAIDTDAAGSPTVLIVGSLRLYVIERGGKYLVREKDTESHTRVNFTDIDRFPVQSKWRIEASLNQKSTPTSVTITNALGQVNESPSPGRLEFTIDGLKQSLIPVGETGESLFIVFGDASNGSSTYGAGRFLSADAPDENGVVILDFNKAVNPPCVFTPYATCPLPPPENQLQIPVSAGEKMWGSHH
jgi:uncharacterized protein